MKAASKSDSRQHNSDQRSGGGSALGVSCFAMGMILVAFVLATNLLQQMTFFAGVVMLGAMSLLPFMVWHSFGHNQSLEISVFTKKAHWQVRLVAILWVIYSFMLLLAVQRTFMDR